MNNRNYNYISLDVIANKIYKNPILKDVNYEDIIDFALSVVKIAKVPGVYQQEGCYKDVISHKVAVPKEALNIKSVDLCYNNNLIPMVMSTESTLNQISKTHDNRDKYGYSNTSNRYTISNSLIITELPECKIFITFDTIRVDENGIPMIPDSEAFIRAVEAYIKLQVYTVMVDLGKLSERALNRVEQEYYFNIGKAQTEFQEIQNEDHMEAVINGSTKFFDIGNDHSTRYNKRGYNQVIKKI